MLRYKYKPSPLPDDDHSHSIENVSVLFFKTGNLGIKRKKKSRLSDKYWTGVVRAAFLNHGAPGQQPTMWGGTGERRSRNSDQRVQMPELAPWFVREISFTNFIESYKLNENV